MAITSFITLKAAVEDYLYRTNIPGPITDAIMLGENRIYRDVRVANMETALSATTSSGVISVPSGYIEMKFMYIDTAPVQALQHKDLSFIYENFPTRSADAKPTFFAREGSNFIFGPFPDTDYAIKGNSYKKQTAFSPSNESNFIITDFPETLLFATLCAMR